MAGARAVADSPEAADLCTCTVSSITFRFERANDCPIHERPRVTFETVAWERVPEQTVCICADVKGVHRRDPSTGATRCGSGNALAFRAILARLEKKAAVFQGCRCRGFYDVDEPLPWLGFTDRLLGDFDTGAPEAVGIGASGEVALPARPNIQARTRFALVWAWKASGLRTNEPERTWNQWLADSKRVWCAWRDAGSPIVAFGKATSFGPASIPALEDR